VRPIPTPVPAPIKSVEPVAYGDVPARRHGVDRGPMKRRPMSGQTGYSDYDVAVHVGFVG
jgi:hypothetical protein